MSESGSWVVLKCFLVGFVSIFGGGYTLFAIGDHLTKLKDASLVEALFTNMLVGILVVFLTLFLLVILAIACVFVAIVGSAIIESATGDNPLTQNYK